MPHHSLQSLFLDQSNDPIWIVDLDNKVIYSNEAYNELCKLLTEDSIDKDSPLFITDFDNEKSKKWENYYHNATKGEPVTTKEELILPQNKEAKHYKITLTPIFDEHQRIKAVGCKAQDITATIANKLEILKNKDATLDVFCTVDQHGNFTYASAAAKEHWGYAPDELMGKPYMDLVIAEDKEKTKAIAQDITDGKEVKSFINRYRKPDGNIAFNLWSVRWDEETKLMYGVARDAKELIEKEARIAKSEQRFKALVQEGSDLIAILDLEGNYKYVSPTSTSVLGISSTEFIGRNAFEFIHPEDKERVKDKLQRITKESRVSIEPYRFQNNEKEYRWIETILTNMTENPAVIGIVANSRDVTDKINKEYTRKLLESVITNTHDAVIITEADPLAKPGPKIIYVNEAFTNMTGYMAEEAIGATPRMLQGPKTSQEEVSKLSLALRNYEPYEATLINYKKNGEEFWVNFNVTPVANEMGIYTHWIAIERDVTEQKNKELENELIANIGFHLNVNENYEYAVREMCKSLFEFGDFDWVELWATGIDKSKLHLVNYFLPDKKDEHFYKTHSNFKTSKKSEGLPGQVWEKKSQLLWDDIRNYTAFKRKNTALEIGLKTVLGIPLLHNNTILGVLIIGTKKKAKYLKKYSRVFERLEQFIGAELKGKMLENDLSHLFDAVPDILGVINVEKSFLTINQAGCKLLGYNEKEILGQSFEVFMHPEEDKNLVSKVIGQLTAEHNTFSFEVRFLKKSGELLWLSWYGKANINEGLIYCSAKDITEKKKLRKLKAQANILAKVGSWEFNLIENDLYWSEEVHHLHETDPDTFTPNVEKALSFYKEEHKPFVGELFDKAINEGITLDYTAAIISRGNKEKWIRVLGSPEYVEDKCVRYIGSFQDITEHKEIEFRLQNLSDNLPGVVFQYHIFPDQSYEITIISKGAEEIWGFTEEEVLENSQLVWDQIEAAGDIQAVQKSIAESIRTKSKWSAEWKYVKPNGEIKTHAGFGSPTFLADRTVIFNSVVFDITEEAKNKELLEQVSNLAKISSWEYDVTEGKVILSNMVYEILETNEEEFTPDFEDSISFYRKDFQDMVRANLEHCMHHGESINYDAIITTPKKNEKWIRVVANAEMHDGKCTRVYGSIQDITEQKEAEQEKHRLQTTLENSLNEIYIFDSETLKFSYVNKGALYNLGYSLNEIRNLTPLDLKPEYSSSSFQELVAPLRKKEKQRVIFFTHHKRKDGSLYPVEVHLQLTSDGSNTKFIAIILDITERKKAEENILKANERFEKVTEATQDVIWDWDIINDSYYRSNAIKNFFGEEAEESMSKRDFWKDRFHPDDLNDVQNSLDDALSDPDRVRWESSYRIYNDHGKIIHVTDRGLIIRNKKGKAIRMIGAMSNVTAQKDYELKLRKLNKKLQKHTKELERSNQELEQFAFVTSHDLQEPLRMVTSFMDQLKRKYEDQLDDKALQYIHFARDGAKRMKQIILDLLDYSRASKPTESEEKIDVNGLVSEFKQLRRKIIAEKSVSIIGENLPVIFSYKAVITQIFHSLLDNAIKYSKEGVDPRIEISAEESKTEWTFSIKDNGIGIDSEFFDKIFVIFQRLHNRTEYEGTGIGLSITKRHIEFLGGKIWVASQLEEGSTFYFTIPK
ncbi:PAS domain S-box protein [Aquimarina brevivitae]|uniref:histidine kinase n=1 Tax=Aquimarina brevivitae TaxID=323412 RepID=A0A4Q7P2U8_9FLAO|nr:PAS domain S-box protein [Aquimarina brevivitae]RZS93947.1 PAS domain S-box-containing protein [Aquimarina brevivitae]